MIDGRYLETAGKGGPTIVLEAGAGSSSATWSAIWPGLARMARVCRYDRPGLGRSAPLTGPSPPTAATVADELQQLLAAAELPPPYLLVGHSMGGLVVRLFAHRYPHLVAGLVLIDSSHPEQSRRGLALLPPPAAGEPPALTGLRARYNDPDTKLDEGINFGRSLTEASQTGHLGDLPLAVLTRAFPATPEALEQVRPGLPTPVGVALEHLWQQMQRELASLSARSSHHVAERSGHYIHQDDPGLVVRAIHQVLAAACQG